MWHEIGFNSAPFDNSLSFEPLDRTGLAVLHFLHGCLRDRVIQQKDEIVAAMEALGRSDDTVDTSAVSAVQGLLSYNGETGVAYADASLSPIALRQHISTTTRIIQWNNTLLYSGKKAESDVPISPAVRVLAQSMLLCMDVFVDISTGLPLPFFPLSFNRLVEGTRKALQSQCAISYASLDDRCAGMAHDPRSGVLIGDADTLDAIDMAAYLTSRASTVAVEATRRGIHQVWLDAWRLHDPDSNT